MALVWLWTLVLEGLVLEYCAVLCCAVLLYFRTAEFVHCLQLHVLLDTLWQCKLLVC